MNGGDTATRIGDLEPREFDHRVRSGLGVQLGSFRARLTVRDEAINRPLAALYRDYRLVPDDGVFHFHARLERRRRKLPWRAARVRFSVDGRVPHADMPAAQSLAVLEWGVNLVVAMRSHYYLMLHAAVVERGGRALLLPAAPGLGKTTLCAGLALSGWRLFSDEFGLVRPGGIDVTPAPRPMALKNASIDVIRRFAPDAMIGPTIPGTRKGDVAHVRPPGDSVARATQTAPAALVVFPEWRPDAECTLEPVSPAETFMLLATNAFNYELQGEAGFDTVRALIGACRSFRLVYSDLREAVARLTRLLEDDDR